MRSLMLVVAALALAALAFSAQPANAQNDEKVRFDTVDQVTLQGIYYPSSKGKKAPTVMMLHKIGGSSTLDGWDKLALELQKQGFAVLIFDFRGHGNSTGVAPSFWNDPVNVKYSKFALPAKPKENISIKDFTTAYYPQLVNDISAAKTYLDKRNDGGDCNSSNLILIGAEDGATLGMMWISSEMHRYRLITPFMKSPTCEGNQITAGVWLSIAPALGTTGVPLKGWVKEAGQEKNVSMAFVYGAKSTADKQIALALLEVAKDRDNKNKWTGEMGIKDTDLKGHGLLSDKVDGRKWIVETYLDKLLKEKPLPVWEEREFKKSPYIWEFPRGSTMGKEPGEDTLRRLPVDLLLNP